MLLTGSRFRNVPRGNGYPKALALTRTSSMNFPACSTHDVVGAAIEVHRRLGPGLLESTYEACLCRELLLRGIAFERQVMLPVSYRGLQVDCGYRLDIVV